MTIRFCLQLFLSKISCNDLKSLLINNYVVTTTPTHLNSLMTPSQQASSVLSLYVTSLRLRHVSSILEPAGGTN
jgi:hypothetical protein